MIFLLKCPNCGNQMKYASASKLVKGKRKRCVYCGKSFEVSTHTVS